MHSSCNGSKTWVELIGGKWLLTPHHEIETSARIDGWQGYSKTESKISEWCLQARQQNGSPLTNETFLHSALPHRCHQAKVGYTLSQAHWVARQWNQCPTIPRKSKSDPSQGELKGRSWWYQRVVWTLQKESSQDRICGGVLDLAKHERLDSQRV